MFITGETVNYSSGICKGVWASADDKCKLNENPYSNEKNDKVMVKLFLF